MGMLIRHIGGARWLAARVIAAMAVILFAIALGGGAAQAQMATSFRSNGDLISGWYWLRDPGMSDYAEFTFSDAPRSGDITLWMTALATDGVNGAPNVNASFDFLVGNPGSGQMTGVFHRIGVTLQNIYPQANPPGYTNHGIITLPRAALNKVTSANGTLFIRIVRASADGPHIAFRPESIKIISGPDGHEGNLMQQLLDDPMMQRLLGEGYNGTVIDGWSGQTGTGGPDGSIVIEGWPGQRGGDIVIEQGGGTVTPPDGTVTPPDGLNLELGDHGDEGQCFLDRPCLGVAADGFRSTGFPGQEGWYWLRAPTVGQIAQYQFEHPPVGQDLVLDIAVLAQNNPGMTPKDSVHVNLVLGYPGSGSLGGQIGPVVIELPNLWQNPDHDIWRARALLVIPQNMVKQMVPAVGGLFLSFERIDAFEPDVGFTAASVLLYPAQDIAR